MEPRERESRRTSQVGHHSQADGPGRRGLLGDPRLAANRLDVHRAGHLVLACWELDLAPNVGGDFLQSRNYVCPPG